VTDIATLTKGARRAAQRTTNGDTPLGKAGGIALAGAALAALPYAAEKLAPRLAGKASDLGGEIKEKAGSQLGDAAKGALPDSPADLLPGGGPLSKLFGGSSNDEGDGQGGTAAPGYGSGRRMPIQQAVDVAVPAKDAFNHWTEYEDWPKFMHRIESAERIDETTVSFQAKIWGVSKRFEAEIIEQRPDERIEWNVTEGYAHTGVVTFHPLSPNLTRIDVSLDIQPANLIDKASRGMRFAKRAVRGDLHRFKAYVELDKDAKRGHRKTIADGKVKRSTPRKRSSGRGSRNGAGAGNGSQARSRSGS
jgi:uncharacterized membrane protein